MKYRLADWLLDTGQMTLVCQGRPADLPLKAVRLLAVLLEAYPAVLNHEQIQAQVWGKTRVSRASVAKLVSDTRRYFAGQGLAIAVIQTVTGEGYRLAEPCWSGLEPVPDLPEPAAAEPEVPAGPGPSTWRTLAWRPALAALVGLVLLFAYLVWSAQPTLQRNEPPDAIARVLWVDDHPDNNASERAWLQARRIAVYQATSSKDALTLLKLYPFDLIISDVGRLHDPLAGLRLLTQVRQQGDQTPLLFYTVTASAALVAEVESRGGQGVAEQPEMLFGLIRAQLERAAEYRDVAL